MGTSPTITRRTLLNLASALALLPLAGCDNTAGADDTPTPTDPNAKGDGLLVPSDHSPVAGNAAWCAPMQICWNKFLDVYNDGQPVPEDGQPQVVADLNDATFTTDMVGTDHYVSFAGLATTEAKAEIEQLIDERFDQKSDILDSLTWADDPALAEMLFYAMLYRQFTFTIPFDVLDNAAFGSEAGDNLTENVAYFGVEDSTKWDIISQVTPLFWESDNRFAVQIWCETDDILILARGAKGSTFDEIWNDIQAGRDAEHARLEVASFACPKLEVDVLTQYADLAGLTVETSSGEVPITEALQTLKFKLDETGGVIKSEAAMAAGSAFDPSEPQPHDFRFDDSFVLFLVDAMAFGSFYPYAGISINNMADFIK